MKHIEEVLNKYEVDIKQIKKSNKDLNDSMSIMTIVGEYNKKMFNKNELVHTLSSLENIGNVSVNTFTNS